MIDNLIKKIHSLFNDSKLRSGLVNLRYPLVALCGAFVIWKSKEVWYWPALAVGMIGALAQVWCFASLEKNKQLCANGPYAIVRNPMYLARFILILGALMLLGEPWLLLLFTVVYWFYMFNRVRREEVRLQKLFGDSYADYCALIRRFLPGIRCYKDNQLLYFRWDFLRRNHGLWNLLGVVIFFLMAGIYLLNS
jgi:protein-S-isoprenylcysteine O-methyltransferase Ste14